MRGRLETFQDASVYEPPLVAGASRVRGADFELPVSRETVSKQAAVKKDPPPITVLPPQSAPAPRYRPNSSGFEGSIYEKDDFLRRLKLVLSHALVGKAGKGLVFVGGLTLATVLAVGTSITAPVSLAALGAVGLGGVLWGAANRFWSRHKGSKTFASRFSSK